MRLLIDENISPIITEKLRLSGYDVKSVKECCKGYDDEKVAILAHDEKRIIITYDLDFGEIYRNLGVSSIVLRLRTKNPSTVANYLITFLKSQDKLNLVEI